jgi:hypothetical protein
MHMDGSMRRSPVCGQMGEAGRTQPQTAARKQRSAAAEASNCRAGARRWGRGDVGPGALLKEGQHALALCSHCLLLAA